MSKFCARYDEAILTAKKYTEQGIGTDIQKVNGKFVVRRATDGKILKSINYAPVELANIVKNEQETRKRRQWYMGTREELENNKSEFVD